ncbi:MAG: hypothetical protein JWN94_2366 [Betaproteobacteria bacterium]|nr:hypothetical protein [Betaproteobacteria bacterium]
MRILLGQLAARGDCLYATAVARQIKADYPGCHLTWAIGSMCRSLLEGNPHVDDIWEIPLASHADAAGAWNQFHATALQRQQNGDFDAAFFTQIYPGNFRNFDGTVRASIFRGYPRPITVPVSPVIRLTDGEIENVKRFAALHGLTDHGPVILFECIANSDQSFLTADFIAAAAKGIVARFPECRLVLSSHVSIASDDPRIIGGNTLTFRENAELTKYCSLLIGCSSGITWLCTSDWAKPLPTIQLLGRQKGVFASVAHDHQYFGLNTDAIIEMTDCPPDDLVDCVKTVYKEGFAAAKKIYHVAIPLDLDFYVPNLDALIRRKHYGDALTSVRNIVRRYGLRPAVLSVSAHTVYAILRSLFTSVIGNPVR